jgi:hypothetical protein
VLPLLVFPTFIISASAYDLATEEVADVEEPEEEVKPNCRSRSLVRNHPSQC